MSRPLRFIPDHSLIEITTRTIQGSLLLRPSAEFNDLILGVLGKAQDTYKMTIHTFVVVSNHAHLLVSPSSAQQLARFMQFVNANIAKVVARLHDWPDRAWSRRYRAILVVDDEAAHARILYQLSTARKRASSRGQVPGPVPTASLSQPTAIAFKAPGTTAAPSTALALPARRSSQATSPPPTTSS